MLEVLLLRIIVLTIQMLCQHLIDHLGQLPHLLLPFLAILLLIGAKPLPPIVGVHQGLLPHANPEQGGGAQDAHDQSTGSAE